MKFKNIIITGIVSASLLLGLSACTSSLSLDNNDNSKNTSSQNQDSEAQKIIADEYSQFSAVIYSFTEEDFWAFDAIVADDIIKNPNEEQKQEIITRFLAIFPELELIDTSASTMDEKLAIYEYVSRLAVRAMDSGISVEIPPEIITVQGDSAFLHTAEVPFMYQGKMIDTGVSKSEKIQFTYIDGEWKINPNIYLYYTKRTVDSIMKNNKILSGLIITGLVLSLSACSLISTPQQNNIVPDQSSSSHEESGTTLDKADVQVAVAARYEELINATYSLSEEEIATINDAINNAGLEVEPSDEKKREVLSIILGQVPELSVIDVTKLSLDDTFTIYVAVLSVGIKLMDQNIIAEVPAEIVKIEGNEVGINDTDVTISIDGEVIDNTSDSAEKEVTAIFVFIDGRWFVDPKSYLEK